MLSNFGLMFSQENVVDFCFLIKAVNHSEWGQATSSVFGVDSVVPVLRQISKLLLCFEHAQDYCCT